MKIKSILATLAVLGILTSGASYADANPQSSSGHGHESFVEKDRHDKKHNSHVEKDRHGKKHKSHMVDDDRKHKPKKDMKRHAGHRDMSFLKNLSNEDKGKLKSMREVHRKELQPLQEKMYSSRLIYKALANNQNTDINAITTVSTEISKLRTEIRQSKHAFNDRVRTQFAKQS